MDRKSAFGSPPQQSVSVKVKWTEEETKYLKDILDQYHNTAPEWKKVSSLLSDVFPNQRAAKSCQTHAARMKLLDHVDVHIKPGTCEAACQTDMTFGPKQPKDIPVQNVIDSQAYDEIIHSYDVDDRTLGNSMDNNFEENRQLEREMFLVEIPMTPAGDNIPQVPVLKPKVTDEHNYNKNGQENTAKKQSHVGAPKKRLQKFLPMVERLTVKPTTLSFLTPKECLNLLSVIKTGNIKSISTQILSVSALRKQIITDIINLVGKRPEQMLNKKKGFVSVLMEKDFKALETVKFEDVLIEFQEKFPELLDMIVAIMLPKDETSVANVVPRLAMIYGIIMQTRHHELSRMQRVVSMCLADNICDQSVYDRLNRIGVSTSYTVALSTINQLDKISTPCQKTVTVPLPCLPYNEQYLQDDVKILTWYQNLFQQVITGSNADPNTKFQIGGDQLTRERLTQAMLLRYGNINPNDEFKNVGRCVAEFFHLGMNFLEKVSE
ncbi:Hypothetical predicted protein [Mytilus galloprovincialis]|uniref:Myb-like domain-containing protein n=2 Tax=Mytilus galloprovincialis TaxID=29158 RepID=A0A8B6E9Y8_MYTGA|nr:Hypothetical predicted protein [Mytilus galloprovincialis]